MHCRDAESMEFNSSGVPWLASAKSLQHAEQSLGCACCWSGLLGEKGKFSSVKSHHLNPPAPRSALGSFYCCNGFVSGGDSPSLKNIHFLLSAVITLKITSMCDRQCIDSLLLICFPTQFFISRFSMSHQVPFKFVLSLWQGASSHLTVLDTFRTRDVCHKAYSLAFCKELSTLQNLDPAIISNKCSPDLQSLSTVLHCFAAALCFCFSLEWKISLQELVEMSYRRARYLC